MSQEEIRSEIAYKKYTLDHMADMLTNQQLVDFTVKTYQEIKQLEKELESNQYRNMMQGRYGIDETRCDR